MVDRVALISLTANRVKLAAVKSAQFAKHLDKALSLLLAELPLQEARALASSDRDELELALREVLTVTDLKKISKKWEPKRKIDRDASQTEIADGLIELLHGKREPYIPISLTLSQARDLRDGAKAELANNIGRVAPASDLKRLAKKWDKHNATLASAARQRVAGGLLSLLEGIAEPMNRRP